MEVILHSNFYVPRWSIMSRITKEWDPVRFWFSSKPDYGKYPRYWPNEIVGLKFRDFALNFTYSSMVKSLLVACYQDYWGRDECNTHIFVNSTRVPWPNNQNIFLWFLYILCVCWLNFIQSMPDRNSAILPFWIFYTISQSWFDRESFLFSLFVVLSLSASSLIL